MEANYKRTVAGSVGAGMAAVFNASGRQYYILEHKTESLYHHAGESQKIIVDQAELGRDSACQVRFDEAFETVSRRHAAIVKEGENWKIIPLSQTNSTIVNGVPIRGEQILNSGDEIRLSSRGPLMGFIVPQGKQSLVSSIGMTERLSLFRQQALRPYKRALWAMAIILIFAIGGLVTWNILQAKKYDQELQVKQEQIEQVQQDLVQSVQDVLVSNAGAAIQVHGQVDSLGDVNTVLDLCVCSGFLVFRSRGLVVLSGSLVSASDQHAHGHDQHQQKEYDSHRGFSFFLHIVPSKTAVIVSLTSFILFMSRCE